MKIASSSAVLSGTWPAGDDELVAHAAALRASAARSPKWRWCCAPITTRRAVEVQVPVAGQVWWRSAVRARLESTQAATRPMTWLHGVTAAITLGIMLAVIGMAWPSLVDGAGWARDVVAAAGGER